MATLTISNKQRGRKLDLKLIRQMGEKLIIGVCENLLRNPAGHLEDTDLEELSENGIFSLVLVSNKQIQKLNCEWMEKDTPTDVLSFPLNLEPPPSAELPWEVGEIVISIEKAEEQAKTFGHSFDRELAFLFVHGALHVLGFDHMSAEDEKDMFGRQKEILNAAGFVR